MAPITTALQCCRGGDVGAASLPCESERVRAERRCDHCHQVAPAQYAIVEDGADEPNEMTTEFSMEFMREALDDNEAELVIDQARFPRS